MTPLTNIINEFSPEDQQHIQEKAKVLALKELVGPGKKVHFVMYRKGYLFYKTDDDFEFQVPVEDCGDGVFLNEDKAMLFMRYIRKQLEANAAGQTDEI